MHTKLAMGMLCFSRPIHTALTLAFAMVNKSKYTDLYAVYGVPKGGTPPSPCMSRLLKMMEGYGVQTIHRRPHYPATTKGGVDTLMHELGAMDGYACYFKIDDDVLIGHGTDIRMADLLLALEGEHKVYMLMGQAVPGHMTIKDPFCWEAVVNATRVVERMNKACPMETYTAVSYKMLPYLRDHGLSDSCDSDRGVYGHIVRKLANIGARSCIALTPHVQMQHIGLTTTIDPGDAPRSWAPARKWQPKNEVIALPFFNFDKWVDSHETRTQKQFALKTIQDLREGSSAVYRKMLDDITGVLESYKPGEGDVDLPPNPKKTRGKMRVIERRPQRERRQILRKLPDGRVARVNRPMRRVVIRRG